MGRRVYQERSKTKRELPRIDVHIGAVDRVVRWRIANPYTMVRIHYCPLYIKYEVEIFKRKLWKKEKGQNGDVL